MHNGTANLRHKGQLSMPLESENKQCLNNKMGFILIRKIDKKEAFKTRKRGQFFVNLPTLFIYH